MKYFIVGKVGYDVEPRLIDEKEGITNNAFGVTTYKGKVIFCDACDLYLTETLTKQEALEMLKELSDWINEQQDID